MEIKVIYEDKDILAINKPAGLLVHGTKDSKEKTLVDWLVQKFPEVKKVGDEPKLRPGIVHRLDKDTSGILLVAKNQKAFEYLKDQFQDKKITKKYIALVQGNVKSDKGVINLAIGKSKKDFRKKAVKGETAGRIREALTEYKVIKRIKHSVFGIFTLVEVWPKTGRTHQIRVHLKAISRPVVCDKLYGPKKAVCPFGLNRHFLHASSLEFSLPSGARIKLEADLPKDLQNALDVLKS